MRHEPDRDFLLPPPLVRSYQFHFFSDELRHSKAKTLISFVTKTVLCIIVHHRQMDEDADIELKNNHSVR